MFFFIFLNCFISNVYSPKPAGKSNTSPGKKFAEKREVLYSSTTFTCRVCVATVDKKVILPVTTVWVP